MTEEQQAALAERCLRLWPEKWRYNCRERWGMDGVTFWRAVDMTRSDYATENNLDLQRAVRALPIKNEDKERREWNQTFFVQGSLL